MFDPTTSRSSNSNGKLSSRRDKPTATLTAKLNAQEEKLNRRAAYRAQEVATTNNNGDDKKKKKNGD